MFLFSPAGRKEAQAARPDYIYYTHLITSTQSPVLSLSSLSFQAQFGFEGACLRAVAGGLVFCTYPNTDGLEQPPLFTFLKDPQPSIIQTEVGVGAAAENHGDEWELAWLEGAIEDLLQRRLDRAAAAREAFSYPCMGEIHQGWVQL